MMNRMELNEKLNYVLDNDLSVKEWNTAYTELFNDCEKKMILAENMQDELFTRFGKNSLEDVYEAVGKDIEKTMEEEDVFLLHGDMDRFDITDVYFDTIKNAQNLSGRQLEDNYQKLYDQCVWITLENEYAEEEIQKAYGSTVFFDIKINAEKAYEEIVQNRLQNDTYKDCDLLSCEELRNKIESVLSSTSNLTLDEWEQAYTELAEDSKKRILMNECVNIAIKEMYGDSALFTILNVAAKDYINKMDLSKKEDLTPEQIQILSAIFDDR